MEVKVILSLESILNYFTGWVCGGCVTGKCETITKLASAEAGAEAQAEFGNMDNVSPIVE